MSMLLLAKIATPKPCYHYEEHGRVEFVDTCQTLNKNCFTVNHVSYVAGQRQNQFKLSAISTMLLKVYL